ncbi:MAG: molybdenum cofactor guanylyltransferase [Phycisphaerales bacterium]|nr:molybdenum cofactor guanylyltransferase [Phycisphaerales bacterium]
MAEPRSIVAGVLFGGRSVRMGVDKALLAWGGATMLESVIAAARAVASECVLLGDLHAPPPSLTGCRRLPDAILGIGPIGGLAALLQHFPGRWCLLLSCDIPAVTPDVLRHLADAVEPGASIVAYRSENGIEPCCALYHADLLPAVQRALNRGQHSLHRVIQTSDSVILPAGDETRRALRNVNTPDDYSDRTDTPPGE